MININIIIIINHKCMMQYNNIIIINRSLPTEPTYICRELKLPTCISIRCACTRTCACAHTCAYYYYSSIAIEVDICIIACSQAILLQLIALIILSDYCTNSKSQSDII